MTWKSEIYEKKFQRIIASLPSQTELPSVRLRRDSAFDRGSFFDKGHRDIMGFCSLSKFKSFQTYFMTMNFLPACIYVHRVCLMAPQELVLDGCEPPWACWSLN